MAVLAPIDPFVVRPMCGNQNVAARLGHVRASSTLKAYGVVRRSSSCAQMDHVHFFGESHLGLFEILAKDAVDQSDRGKVLHAREASPPHFFEKELHHPERIGAADARQHGSLRDDRQHFAGHIHHDGVGITVGHHPRQRAAPAHPKSAGVVDHDQINPAGLFEFCTETGPGPATEDRLASGDFGFQSIEDFLAIEHQSSHHQRRVRLIVIAGLGILSRTRDGPIGTRRCCR